VTRRTLVTAVSLLAALLASCGGAAESPDPSSTTTTTTSPVADSPSTTVGETTTLQPATTSTPPSGTSPPTSATHDGASGSGCSPGDSVTLPEGEWFGFVESTSASGIEFDLACWFAGQAAIDAAAEDGEESPPPNDYYVRNDNPTIRSLDVSSDTEVTWYPTGDPASEAVVTFEEWAEDVVGRGFMFGVWLAVIDGEVFEIREQWVP
jgi:hypothetical protein